MINPQGLAAFLVTSLVLATLTRTSLLRPSSPGFFRFFAWETILVLFLLAVPYWLQEMTALHQLTSWALLMTSPCLLIPGLLALRRYGNARGDRRGDHLLPFERTTQLVTGGVFHYVRHPMYGSLMLLNWGLFWKHPSFPAAGLACMATLFLALAVRLEENENLRVFGIDYRHYMQRTKRFVPFVI